MTVKVGRNDACPCGSGQKYKKCCMAADSGMKAIHQVDNQLRQQLMDYSRAKFGQDAFAEARGEPVPEDVLPLFIGWMLFHHAIDGATVGTWYGREHGSTLYSTETAWLSAQGKTLLSVWKVLAVTPGQDVVLEDVFTGLSRTVADVNASRSLKPLTSLLCRVTDFEDYTVISGAHPQPLTPMHAFQVQQAFTAWLGRPPVASDLLAGPSTLQLMRLWQRVAEAGARQAPGGLSNSDGEPLELTITRMTFDPQERQAIQERLLASPDLVVEAIESDMLVVSRKSEPRPGQPLGTVVATVMLGTDTLDLQTNSRPRADRYRTWLETATEARVRYVETQPMDWGTYTQALHRAAPPQQPGVDDGMAAMRLFKAQHYQGWLDEALPALNQQSPRTAVGTLQGRQAVLALLEDMEFREQQEPLYVRYDFSGLRRELGL